MRLYTKDANHFSKKNAKIKLIWRSYFHSKLEPSPFFLGKILLKGIFVRKQVEKKTHLIINYFEANQIWLIFYKVAMVTVLIQENGNF